MMYFFQFIFYSFYFFIKLYSLFDKYIMFSGPGAKLDKHINNQKNIACSLSYAKKIKDFFLMSFKKKSNLPNWYKQMFLILLISINILIFKIAISYDFLYSNVLFLNLFNKKLELSTILQNKYILFKILYYVFFYIFIFIIIKKIYSIYFYQKVKEYPTDKFNEERLKIELIKTEKENVIIEERGMYQNLLITGSIGAGKTSSAISNIVDSLIKQNIGGLIIDIKGNYINQVNKIAQKYKKESNVVEISLNNEFRYNPLDDNSLPSCELANIIKKVLLMLANSTNNSDPFWLDKSESYISDFITIIRACNEFVSFEEIHKLVIDNNYLNEKLNILKTKILNNCFSDSELFSINSAILNINNDYLNLDDRTFGIIRSEITRMTSVFLSDINIYNKFCKKGYKLNFLSNKIYVLNLDISTRSKLSKLIATYVKLQFQRQLLNNKDFKSPVFFICDEYQEICNEEDANFFSLSREFRCINVISIQSYSSLVSSLKNENISNVIIQNFINKIWFRNDDVYTVEKIISQIGKEKIVNKTKTYGENGKNTRFSRLTNGFKAYNFDFSSGYSETETIQNKYNQEFFTQKLKTFEAMCLISDGINIKIYEKVTFKRWEE